MNTPVDNSDRSASTCRWPSVEYIQDTRRPGSRANDVPGLADQKDTRRLMDMMTSRPPAGQA